MVLTKRPSNLKETELGKWLHAVTKREREELAYYAGCDVYYLRVLAGVHRENPKLRLALAIVRGSEIINTRHNASHPDKPYPAITLAGLASPTKRDDDGYQLPAEILCKD